MTGVQTCALPISVLDEKMKDSVKITVIATGFKDGEGVRRRSEATHASFAASREVEDFPETASEPEPPAPPRVMEHAATQAVSTEPVSLDAMRTAMIANFEQEDLDVPAFLRKRGEVI